MPAAVLSVRVDSDVKTSFAELCDELGLSPSAAVNVFMRQMLRDRSFPFVPSAAKADERSMNGALSLSFIERAVRSVLSRRDEVASAVLFGSYARGDASVESDIDLRITLREGTRMGAFALASLSDELREALGRSVDLVSADCLDAELQTAIDHEGVLIYERA